MSEEDPPVSDEPVPGDVPVTPDEENERLAVSEARTHLPGTRTLDLTTPMMHGADVFECQYLLNTNRFKQNYRPGERDGVFGPETAGACRRAKYWMGYPMGHMTPQFGKQLRSYLIPSDHKLARRLPADYRVRRSNRMRRYTSSWRDKVVDYAISQEGYKEWGYDHTKYNIWYYGFDNPAPWCLIFVSYCISNYGGRHFHQAYVPALVDLAKGGQLGYHIVTYGEAIRGDIVCYDWDHNGTADHAEFLAKKENSSTFNGVGGNTGANSNEVASSTRYLSEVQHFVRVP
jgi:hypothetical protein